MMLGVTIWIILIIVLLGGFKVLAIIAAVAAISFIAGVFLAINDKKERSEQ